MSDLQCAARLLLVRHAEAEYETDLLSDAGGSLSPAGREQAERLADSLRSERVASIYSSGMARAVQTAEIVAARLGLRVTVLDGLHEWSVGAYAGQRRRPGMFEGVFSRWHVNDLEARIPGGESAAEIIARVRSALDSIVDLHRGETVLVVTHTGALMTALPQLASNLRADFCAGRDSVPPCGIVELAVDADGWVVRSWAGEPVDE